MLNSWEDADGARKDLEDRLIYVDLLSEVRWPVGHMMEMGGTEFLDSSQKFSNNVINEILLFVGNDKD